MTLCNYRLLWLQRNTRIFEDEITSFVSFLIVCSCLSLGSVLITLEVLCEAQGALKGRKKNVIVYIHVYVKIS